MSCSVTKVIVTHFYPDSGKVALVGLQRNLDKTSVRQDICIGTDNFYTPKELVDNSVHFFESAGLSVKVNSPYNGTIVTLKHYGKDDRVNSIMIEVNKKLYVTDVFQKSKNYKEIQELCQTFIRNFSFK